MDSHVRAAIIGCGVLTFASAATAYYDSLYASSLGAEPVEIGLINSVALLNTAASGVLIGWVAEWYGVRRAVLLMLGLFLVHQAIYTLAWNWWVLVAAVAVSSRMVRMGPFADIIIVTSVNPERRAFVISLSRVVWNSLAMAAPMVAAVIVSSFGGISSVGIRPLYVMQLALCLLVFLYLARSLPPTVGRIGLRDGQRQRPTRILGDYLDSVRGDAHLRRWVLLRILQSFGMSLAAPFYSIWLVDVKRADPYLLGTLSTLSLLTSTVLQMPAGWLADRVGRKKVFLLFQPFSYVGTLVAIAASRPEHLMLAAALGSPIAGMGGLAGLAFPAFITLWWESIPEEMRGRFFGVESLFSLASIPASLLGGLLWQSGFVTEVMLLPILIDVAAVLPMFASLPEGRVGRPAGF